MQFEQRRTSFRAAILTIAVLFMSSSAAAQADTSALWVKARDLIRQSKLTEAVPVLEQIIELDPKDAQAHTELGNALLGKAVHEGDARKRAVTRIAARNAFIKARDLGDDSNFVKAMIGSLPDDGSEGRPFSEVPRSHALTFQGEQAFTQGRIDEALQLYKQALELDPKNYYAALFSGDMYLKKEDFGNAEVWYQKAIAIDPNRETAYRYSATPLMRQRKYDEARERYIQAWITDPYSRFAVNGILQWGQVTGTKLGHPKIDVPKIEVGPDGKAKTTININPLADDGSMAWMAYVTTRELWKNEKFARSYPSERSYRHSLREETEALRDVVKMAKSLKPKTMNPQIEVIEKLDNEGLLEAFVLMAIPTQGVVADHSEYLRTNREKLRQYVIKWVIIKDK